MSGQPEDSPPRRVRAKNEVNSQLGGKRNGTVTSRKPTHASCKNLKKLTIMVGRKKSNVFKWEEAKFLTWRAIEHSQGRGIASGTG